MFETISAAPPDAILGLSEAFRNDPNPDKINLSIGVYQAADGKTPVLDVVHEAEQRLALVNKEKTYLPISGSPTYAACVQKLLFGEDHDVMATHRAMTAQTLGGTGAIRVTADFLKANLPGVTVWLSQPTWPNHPNIFTAAGVPTKSYSYFNASSGELDFEGLLQSIGAIPAGDAILLHGCCHNPTGVDPSPDQWQAVVDRIRDRNLVPIIDLAYQGFADGIVPDVAAIRLLAGCGVDLIICSSFSKNFGLYCERVGALTMVTANQSVAETVASQVKQCIRANYSNPPAHGGAIVTTVLSDPELRLRWEKEVALMRDRIHKTRMLLAEKLQKLHVPGNYAFLARQRGMFSLTSLTPSQVDMLRNQYSIYIVRSGRINVAGINAQNMDRLCAAIQAVTGP